MPAACSRARTTSRRPARSSPRRAPHRSPSALDLLDAAKLGDSDRLLVLGDRSPELLCAALSRGCRSAASLVAPPEHPEAADVVVAPQLRSAEAATAIAACARRAFAAGRRGGRLALALLGAGGIAAARAVAKSLETYGFTRARLRARAEGGVLLTCRFPAPANPVR